jgi:glycosyltransferase involved in cell wall biosynthesis
VEFALLSVLNQDYENIELIVSDDSSSDNTQNIIENILQSYKGNKKIIKSFNEINMGLVNNFNKTLEIATGEIIAVAAGDDISFPTRVSNAVALIENDPSINLVSFSDVIIDENGVQKPARQVNESKVYELRDLALDKRLSISGASRVFRRELYDFFGYLNSSCPTEDSPFILRSMLLGKAVVLSNPGIYYRVHSLSISQPKSLYEMDFDSIYDQYLDDLSKVYAKRLVSFYDYISMVKWVGATKEYRDLEKNLYYSKSKLSVMLKAFIFSKLSFRRRLMLVKKYYLFVFRK